MLTIKNLPLTVSDLVFSQNLSFISSLNQKAVSLSEQGVDVLKLSGGDPSHAPDRLLNILQDIGCDSDRAIFNYSPIAGLEHLRECLASIIDIRYLNKYTKENILICSGACSGLFLTLKTILNPGDRVLIQDPCWEYLPRLIENCAAIPITLNFFSDITCQDHWDILLEEIHCHLISGIKVITINSPLNPSGKIIPIEILNSIVKLCVKYNAWCISDDVTTDFNYDRDPKISINNLQNFISVNSFSKNIGITGLRFGFVAGSLKFINQLKKTQLYTCMYPNSLVQEIIKRYLSYGENEYFEFIEGIVSLYQHRADGYSNMLSTIPELEVFKPEGGLFLFPRIKNGHPLDFEKLLNQYHLAVAPGEAFGLSSKNHFRIFLGVEKDCIVESVQKLKSFFAIS